MLLSLAAALDTSVLLNFFLAFDLFLGYWSLKNTGPATFFCFSLFQILEGVQDRAVPVVPSAQVYAAQTLYVL